MDRQAVNWRFRHSFCEYGFGSSLENFVISCSIDVHAVAAAVLILAICEHLGAARAGVLA